jgi:hypothetical protein
VVSSGGTSPTCAHENAHPFRNGHKRPNRLIPPNLAQELMAGPIRVRNKRGELIDAPQFTASEAKHKFGQLLDAALRVGPVTITRQR